MLTYRLPHANYQPTPPLTPLPDAQRAMHTVRARAAEWNIHPGKVGIMGFSAGGYLASTLATHLGGGEAATGDTAVAVQNSLLYDKVCQEAGVPAEMPIYPGGGHGFGLAMGKGYLSTWPDRLVDWLRSLQ